ncbi:MAG: N-acetyltransferase [Erysipelotrichia bacterium]|nr:N-acetyltransferase [Erysipelotrichia bacterium]
MKHKGTVRLETERMILRRICVEDAPEIYENWASDPEVTKFLTWPPHASVSVTEKICRMWSDSYSQPDFYHWGMELKSDHTLLGNISTVGINEEMNEVTIGYCLGKKWWHQGYMSEALNRIIDFFFEEVDANRVQSDHDPHNPHSGMVMKKCGMTLEGTLRQHAHNNQGIADDCIYGILKSDRHA